MFKYKGNPIHICDKIPKNIGIWAVQLDSNCPFCGGSMSDDLRLKMADLDAENSRKGLWNGSPTFYSLLDQMRNTHHKKSHDYANNDNPYGNYHFAGMLSKLFNNSDDAGFVGRLGEKLYRLATLENGNKLPMNETIEDTETDLCVIMALWVASRRDRRSLLKVGRKDLGFDSIMPDESSMLSCKLCNYSFFSRDKLISHYMAVHNGQYRVSDNMIVFPTMGYDSIHLP